MDLDTHGSVVILVGTSRKHLCRRSPAHSWTPIIPKIKKTKKQSRRTLPNIGRVSSSNMTKIRIPEKEMVKIIQTELLTLFLEENITVHISRASLSNISFSSCQFLSNSGQYRKFPVQKVRLLLGAMNVSILFGTICIQRSQPRLKWMSPRRFILMEFVANCHNLIVLLT